MMVKGFWESKTFWFNLLALGVAIALCYGYGQFVPAPEVEQIAGGLVALIGVLLPVLTPVINMVLRFVTRQPVALRASTWAKSVTQSKTLIFNLLALAVGIALYFGYGEFTPAPEMGQIAGGLVALIGVLLPVITPIVNMLLRLVTNQAIVFKR
jgi:hypothetical protein